MKPLPLKVAGGKGAVSEGSGFGHLSPLWAFRSWDRPGRQSLVRAGFRPLWPLDERPRVSCML